MKRLGFLPGKLLTLSCSTCMELCLLLSSRTGFLLQLEATRYGKEGFMYPDPPNEPHILAAFSSKPCYPISKPVFYVK